MISDDLIPIIEKYAKMNGVSPDLIMKIIEAESSGDPNAVSHDASGQPLAHGLMQLMPATAKELGVTDPYDPEQSIMGGTKHVARLLQKYRDPRKAIAAYNFGEGNVDSGKPFPKETLDYQVKVLGPDLADPGVIPLAGGPATLEKTGPDVAPTKTLTYEQITSDPDFSQLSEQSQLRVLAKLVGPEAATRHQATIADAGPKLSPGIPGAADEPSTPPEALDRVMEASGVDKVLNRLLGIGQSTATGTMAPKRDITPSIKEKPLNETDLAAILKGLSEVASVASVPFIGGAALGLPTTLGAAATGGMTPAAILTMLGLGGVGAAGGEKLGRTVGTMAGAPETGSVLGENLGGLAGGVGGAMGGMKAFPAEKSASELASGAAARALEAVRGRPSPKAPPGPPADLLDVLRKSIADVTARTYPNEEPVRGTVATTAPTGWTAAQVSPTEWAVLDPKGRPVASVGTAEEAQRLVQDVSRISSTISPAERAEASSRAPVRGQVYPTPVQEPGPRAVVTPQEASAQVPPGGLIQPAAPSVPATPEEAQARDALALIRKQIVAGREATPPRAPEAALSAEARVPAPVMPADEAEADTRAKDFLGMLRRQLIQQREAEPPPPAPAQVTEPVGTTVPTPAPGPQAASGTTPTVAQSPETARIGGREYRVGDTVVDGPHVGKKVLEIQDGLPTLSKKILDSGAAPRENVPVAQPPVEPLPSAAPAEPPVPASDSLVERRVDSNTRKRVAHMTPEEMQRALLTDEMTGLGNRRAYEETDRLPVQVKYDAEGLKHINDTFGEEAGNEVIRAIGRAFKEEDIPAYRMTRGDEFASEHSSPEEALAAIGRVKARLADSVIEATLPDGSVKKYKGINLHAGTGDTYAKADTALSEAKKAAVAAGERAERGAAPKGLRPVEDSRPTGEPAPVTPAGAEPQGVAGEPPARDEVPRPTSPATIVPPAVGQQVTGPEGYGTGRITSVGDLVTVEWSPQDRPRFRQSMPKERFAAEYGDKVSTPTQSSARQEAISKKQRFVNHYVEGQLEQAQEAASTGDWNTVKELRDDAQVAVDEAAKIYPEADFTKYRKRLDEFPVERPAAKEGAAPRPKGQQGAQLSAQSEEKDIREAMHAYIRKDGVGEQGIAGIVKDKEDPEAGAYALVSSRRGGGAWAYHLTKEDGEWHVDGQENPDSFYRSGGPLLPDIPADSIKYVKGARTSEQYNKDLESQENDKGYLHDLFVKLTKTVPLSDIKYYLTSFDDEDIDMSRVQSISRKITRALRGDAGAFFEFVKYPGLFTQDLPTPGAEQELMDVNDIVDQDAYQTFLHVLNQTERPSVLERPTSQGTIDKNAKPESLRVIQGGKKAEAPAPEPFAPEVPGKGAFARLIQLGNESTKRRLTLDEQSELNELSSKGGIQRANQSVPKASVPLVEDRHQRFQKLVDKANEKGPPENLVDLSGIDYRGLFDKIRKNVSDDDLKYYFKRMTEGIPANEVTNRRGGVPEKFDKIQRRLQLGLSTDDWNKFAEFMAYPESWVPDGQENLDVYKLFLLHLKDRRGKSPSTSQPSPVS